MPEPEILGVEAQQLTPREQNKKRIEDKVEELRSITDRLGMPIDQGIIETVAVLQILGINTTASCEGHVDHGTGSPYIDVSAPGTKEEKERNEFLRKRALKESLMGKVASILDQIDRKDRLGEYIRLAKQSSEVLLKKNKEMIDKLDKLLQVFYQQRTSESEFKLKIDRRFIDGEGRLRPAGADVFEERIKSGQVTNEERERFLTASQSEIAAFTTWLKELLIEHP